MLQKKLMGTGCYLEQRTMMKPQLDITEDINGTYDMHNTILQMK